MYKILGGDGKEYGPVSTETLQQWITEGRANAQTQVLPDGGNAWVMLGTLPEFANAAEAAGGPATFSPGAGAPYAADRAGALPLAVPAGWALTVVGLLGVLMCIAMLIYFSIVGVEGNAMFAMMNQQPMSDAMRAGQKIGFLASFVVGIGWAAFIAWAGGKLRRLESWGLVLTAAILCVLPCCGTQFPLCILSAPVGVWAIVVLCQGKVKGAFA